MSEIDDLIQAYSNQVSMEWKPFLSGDEKVWFVVYDPPQERRVRLRLGDFEISTKAAGHGWHLVDVTASFGQWMAHHDYRDSYFEDPESLEIDLQNYEEYVREQIVSALRAEGVNDNTVVAVLGVGTLFGLTKVSAVLENLTEHIQGRLAVFFPGRHDEKNYRLLDARDGWDYLAIPIKAK